MSIVKTITCWLIAYFSSFYYLLRGVAAWIADPAVSLQDHFHEGSRRWARLLLRLSGIRINLVHRENLDILSDSPGPYVIACNHQSVVDILVLLDIIPLRFAFFAKRTLFFIPVFGWYLWLAGYIPVNRGDPRSAWRSVDDAARRLSSNVSIVIFPEGSRSEDGRLGRFKSGFVRMAARTGAKILPIAISGSRKVLPKGAILMKPAVVDVLVGTPVEVEKDALKHRDARAKTVEKVRESVSNLLKEAQ